MILPIRKSESQLTFDFLVSAVTVRDVSPILLERSTRAKSLTVYMVKVIFALRRVSLLAFFLVIFAVFDHESFLGTAADVELLSSYSKGALSTVSNLSPNHAAEADAEANKHRLRSQVTASIGFTTRMDDDYMKVFFFRLHLMYFRVFEARINRASFKEGAPICSWLVG